MPCFLGDAKAFTSEIPLQPMSLVSQSTNCGRKKNTRLPVLIAHTPSYELVVVKTQHHAPKPVLDPSRKSSSTRKQPKIFQCTRASSSETPTLRIRRLETCVQSRELLVREIAEFVNTQFEREILSVGSAQCGSKGQGKLSPQKRPVRRARRPV